MRGFGRAGPLKTPQSVIRKGAILQVERVQQNNEVALFRTAAFKLHKVATQCIALNIGNLVVEKKLTG